MVLGHMRARKCVCIERGVRKISHTDRKNYFLSVDVTILPAIPRS